MPLIYCFKRSGVCSLCLSPGGVAVPGACAAAELLRGWSLCRARRSRSCGLCCLPAHALSWCEDMAAVYPAGGSCSVRNEGEGEQREAARRAMRPAGAVATSMGGGGIAWDTKAHVHLEPWSPGSQTGILLWEMEVCCLFSIIDL